ncbi:hypothetical protein GC209_12325 [bacterium]|nr:hypothetical protein [bacterium]
MFDRSLLDQGDIVSDMMRLIGISGEGLVRTHDQNVSLSRVQARVGHIANEIIGDNAVTQRLLDALYAAEDRMLPSAEAARAFLAPYRDSNRRLNARLGLTPFPDLFPDDFSDYPDVASDTLSQDESDTALRAVVRTLGTTPMHLHALTADDLRESARALFKTEPWLALRLARAALSLRPKGPAIIKMVADLEARLR